MLEGRKVHGAGVERLVEAAPPPLAARHQPQVGRRFDRRGGQDGIHEFKQGVAPAPKERVHLLAEGSELFPFWSRHTRRMSSRVSLCPLAFTDTSLWLKLQVKDSSRHAEPQSPSRWTQCLRPLGLLACL